MPTGYGIDLHSWRVTGNAPSTGDGKRTELTCIYCKSVISLRWRRVLQGRLTPCRCQEQQPDNTQKENNA